MSSSDEQRKAAEAYSSGAAQRDPQSVRNATSTAASNGGAAAGAKGGRS